MIGLAKFLRRFERDVAPTLLPHAKRRRSAIFELLETRVLLSGNYVLSTLVPFNGGNGSQSTAALIADSAGNLYGTTAYGGANGDGTVFEIAAATHSLSTLVTFNGNNGANPFDRLIFDAGGNLYGTTGAGGANGDGTVFEVASGTHSLTTLFTFNGSNGSAPVADLIFDSTGNLYGTTFSGGTDGDGTVFQLAASTQSLTTLLTFTGSNGSAPVADLIFDSTGNLYGTTNTGGADSDGTVFELAAGTHSLTTLVTFNGSNGAAPVAGLIFDAGGNLDGTTNAGGADGGGIVFQLAAGTHSLTTLATFNGSNGYGSEAGLMLDSAGNLYGTTRNGGAADDGAVFEFTVASHSLTDLITFNGADNGNFPEAGLVADTAGNLYGTTRDGGTGGDGTLFELSPSLLITTPAAAASVNVGSTFEIDWTGGASTDNVQLWTEGGPNNSWTELAASLPQSLGHYDWNTAGVAHGWYYFLAWDTPANGTSYSVQSPNYLHLVAPSVTQAPTVSLNSPTVSGASVIEGSSYALNWTTTQQAGDTNPVFVQLWVYSGDTGQWSVLPNASDIATGASGSYMWNTTAVEHGWYSFAAHVTDGDLWGPGAASPGWLHVELPVNQTPTFTFLTPTSAQTVTGGTVFNLQWNATAPAQDAGLMTVQLWAEHLVDNNGTTSAVWTEIAASLNPATGSYSWTTPVGPTYYAFAAYMGYADVWVNQASTNWLQVT